MKTSSHGSASSRSCRCRIIVLSGLFAAVTIQLSAGALENIAVSSTAAPLYVRPLDPAGKPLPETYIFSQGKYFGGDVVDKRLAKFSFNDVIKMLAVNLAKQNYFPTKDVPAANLVLVVHWGDTTIFHETQKDLSADALNSAVAGYKAQADSDPSGHADPGLINAALASQESDQASAQAAIARNAELLGFKKALQKEQSKLFPSPEEETMTYELNEERYFVIIMAYDYQYMQKEHKPRLVWVTRMSVRSPGNNFNEAMPALAEAGAKVFGKQVDTLVRVDSKERGGRVDLGEMKVMGTVESTEPAEKKK